MYIYIPVPHDECNHYALQTYSNKKGAKECRRGYLYTGQKDLQTKSLCMSALGKLGNHKPTSTLTNLIVQKYVTA